MDEFTSRIEEISSKLSTRRGISASQPNLTVYPEVSNGSAPTTLFVAGLGNGSLTGSLLPRNGSLTGSLLPHSSSSSQLARESVMDEVFDYLMIPTKNSE